MTTKDVTDALLGKATRLALNALIAVLVGALTWVANSIKDEFKSFNDRMTHEEEVLGDHTATMARIQENIAGLTRDLRTSVDSIATLANTITIQATAEAQLKQRLDDADPILRAMQPLGVRRERGQ